VSNGSNKEVQVERNPRMFLEEAYRSRLDPGQVYVASEIVDLPAKATDTGEKAK
jgi:hypothetical protein